MAIDFTAISVLLNKYQEEALEEYGELEEKRHKQLGDLFKVEKEIPLLGIQRLSGGHPKVIKKALKTYEALGVGSYSDTATNLKKYGKYILQRATFGLKAKYEDIAKYGKGDDLLHFLTLVVKAEAQILKIDHKRAKDRFSTMKSSKNTCDSPQVYGMTYTEELQHNNKSIDAIVEDFCTTSVASPLKGYQIAKIMLQR